jgi:site-specific DNA-cytosine methylase
MENPSKLKTSKSESNDPVSTMEVPSKYYGSLKNILVVFECSGIAREAFATMYPNTKVTSVDLNPSEIPCSWNAQHWQIDARDAMAFNGDSDGPWDLIIAFVPCDHLAVSGARWFPEKRVDGRQQAAIDLFMFIANYNVERIAIENPIGIMSTLYRKPDQIIQPWQFGHGETKSTCLWLKNLPKLIPTNIVEGREARVHKMAPGPNRARDRARTYKGIAEAMAEQWGCLK